MAKKRKKARMPARLLLLWSAADQQRFIDTVERLTAQVNDLQTMIAAERERRSTAAHKANETRRRREEILAIIPPQEGQEPGAQ